jgi:hypothetical protein
LLRGSRPEVKQTQLQPAIEKARLSPRVYRKLLEEGGLAKTSKISSGLPQAAKGLMDHLYQQARSSQPEALALLKMLSHDISDEQLQDLMPSVSNVSVTPKKNPAT